MAKSLTLWLTLILVAGAVLVIPAAAQVEEVDSTRPLWRSLRAGPNRIGFRLTYVAGKSIKGRDRGVRLAIWYPAHPQSGDAKMLFKDYLEVKPTRVRDVALEAWMNSRDRKSLSKQYFDTGAKKRQAALMAAPIPVIADAPAAEGAFPLVLHSLGRNGNQFQHTILWEYLASHGYVVVSVAQYGKDLTDPTMAFSAKDLRFQLDDMQSAIAGLDRFSFVDTSRLGVLGHSSGAIVALWLSVREPRIKGVVGLDGSQNRSENQKVFREGLDGQQVSIPFLNICRWPHDEYYGKFAEQVKSEIVRVGFERAIHFDFQNWPAYQAFADGKEPSSMAVRSVAEAERVFVASAAITRLFLDAQIKSDTLANKAIMDEGVIRKLSNGQASLTIDPGY